MQKLYKTIFTILPALHTTTVRNSIKKLCTNEECKTDYNVTAIMHATTYAQNQFAYDIIATTVQQQ